MRRIEPLPLAEFRRIMRFQVDMRILAGEAGQQPVLAAPAAQGRGGVVVQRKSSPRGLGRGYDNQSENSASNPCCIWIFPARRFNVPLTSV